MVRIMAFDRLDAYKFDLDPDSILSLTSVEAINGEHSLTVATTQALEKTDRLVIRDGMGDWHEYVVTGIEETHDEAGDVVPEYYAIWSLQYDLSATFIDNQYGCGVVPGHASVPQVARRGMECALEGTSRWEIGTVSVMTMASASFYRRSGWDGLLTVVEKWGGELQATITVGPNGVTGRAADLLEHVGTSTATRRFDYGFDVTRIRRVVSDDVWPCRIVPLGKSMETEAGGYTRRPSIKDVNDGVMWLQDDSVVDLVKVRGPNWTWEYPTSIVLNDTYEDPSDLKQWALEHISEYTRPIVSYEADVAQFVAAGMDPHGVALGDDVVVVDRTFPNGGLRISARVIKQKCDLLDPSATELTIGNFTPSLSSELGGLQREVTGLAEQAATESELMATSAYVQNLLDRLNATANATGGWTYITQGEGIRTYDAPVSDPLVGDEASAVVEVKGGTVRIASSRTPSGDWEWLTVFTSGHVAAEAVTALNVTAGFISGINGTYIDLESGLVVLGDESGFHMRIDETELGFYQGSTRVAYLSNEMLYIPLAVGINALQVGGEGSVSWQWKLRDNGNFQLKWMGGEE